MDYLYVISALQSAPEPYPGPKRNVRLYDDNRTSDLASNFRPPPVTGEIAPKRSAGRRKRQPQERQHSADAESGGTRDRLQSRDRLRRPPQRGSDSGAGMK